MFTSLLKDIDEQPNKEIHKARSGRVPRAGPSVSVELRYVTLLEDTSLDVIRCYWITIDAIG